MITANHLSKVYGWVRAVDEVSFDIRRGECVGLLGLNGAGKTTLLRMMSCLLTPTAGSMSINGVDVSGAPELIRHQIGYLPEEPPLYGEMAVDRFLDFVARLRKVPAEQVDERLTDTLKRCQLEAVRGQRIETLSYGYKKRVGIAQAIVHRPPFVILDEPIAGLDPAQIVEMRDLVRGLGGEHTVVLSSHILTEISQTCDRILVMHRGRIVASGSEEELSSGLASGLTVTVQVRATHDQLRKVLGDVKGIQDHRIVNEEDGVLTVEVLAASDLREEIGRALVQAGLGLLELSRKYDKLESIFLSLTGEEGT